MATLQQLKRKKRVRWFYKDKRKALMKCPQRKGICLRVYSMTPRKPNSAIRKVARVLLSNWNRVTAYLPGEGMNSLQQHSVVLVRGGRVKDLPGVKYTMIRGKYDLRRLQKRGEKRSKYGVHCFIHSKYKRI